MIIPWLCGIFYQIGGGGYKWVRRYGISLILAAYSWNIWVGLLCFSAFILPYGDDEVWWVNIIAALAHSVVSLPIGFGIWNPMTFVVVSAVMFYLGKKIPWKVCEFLMGFSVGMQFL